MSASPSDLLQQLQEAEVRPDAIPSLLAQLAALQGALAARLLSPPAHTEAEGERLLTIPEAAERLSVPKGHAYDLARRGKLPTVKLGKYVRVRPDDLREYIARHRNGQKG